MQYNKFSQHKFESQQGTLIPPNLLKNFAYVSNDLRVLDSKRAVALSQELLMTKSQERKEEIKTTILKEMFLYIYFVAKEASDELQEMGSHINTEELVEIGIEAVLMRLHDVESGSPLLNVFGLTHIVWRKIRKAVFSKSLVLKIFYYKRAVNYLLSKTGEMPSDEQVCDFLENTTASIEPEEIAIVKHILENNLIDLYQGKSFERLKNTEEAEENLTTDEQAIANDVFNKVFNLLGAHQEGRRYKITSKLFLDWLVHQNYQIIADELGCSRETVRTSFDAFFMHAKKQIENAKYLCRA